MNDWWEVRSEVKNADLDMEINMDDFILLMNLANPNLIWTNQYWLEFVTCYGLFIEREDGSSD